MNQRLRINYLLLTFSGYLYLPPMNDTHFKLIQWIKFGKESECIFKFFIWYQITSKQS